MSSSSSSPSTFAPPPPPDHHHHLLPNSDQLRYVHCKVCDTLLVVSVPCTSLFKTVTVRCGHCTNILSVNMPGPMIPIAGNHLLQGLPFFPSQNLMEEIRTPPVNEFINYTNHNESPVPLRQTDEYPKPPVTNRPPEKRQRVPSVYNRFIKEEIQRIKAENPDITHREAFSAAAKNWAHFPRIHFGLMPELPVKKRNVCQQEGDDVVSKEGFLAPAAANVGISPY